MISTSLSSRSNNLSCTPGLAVLVMTSHMQRERKNTLYTGNRTKREENILPYTIRNFKYGFVPSNCLLRTICKRCTSPRKNIFSVRFILRRFCSEGMLSKNVRTIFYLVQRFKNALHFPYNPQCNFFAWCLSMV